MLELNSNLREHMVYRIYAVIGSIIVPFGVWTWLQGNTWLGLQALATAALSLYNAAHFRMYRRFLVDPIIISLAYIAINVVSIREAGNVAVFWAYPTMLAFYWVHSRKIAQHIVPLFFVCVCLSVVFWLPPDYAVRITVTLLLMGIFFHIASGLMEQQYQDVIRLSITDHLTGAYNRRFMDSKIDELIERQKRFHASATMISLDVDHFKTINDHFGHSSGDKVLVEIVKLLTSRVRVLDKVCRSGGEEFVILLPDTTEQAAYAIAEDIRRSISDSQLINPSTITISCGIAALRPGDSRDSWLKRSDNALYQAKADGRNKVVITSSKAKDLLVGVGSHA